MRVRIYHRLEGAASDGDQVPAESRRQMRNVFRVL